MKGRYDAQIEQAKRSKSTEVKQDCTITILDELTGNHLPTLETKINKLTWLIMALLVAVLFSSKDSISWLYMIIMRLF